MLKKAKTLVAVTLFLILPSALLIADWQPGDGHKMHHPQLPDEAGWDVDATVPLVLADDWQCSETGWVKDIHFWGSWLDDDIGIVDSFVLSIHSDIPADQNPDGYSKPGETLWERVVSEYAAVPIDPPTMEGWYDPANNIYYPDNHQSYFQYNVFLDEVDWFWQFKDTIYWLNISAFVSGPSGLERWGWKSSINHWNDDAVWAFWGELNWQEMYEPADADTVTNAFWVTVDAQGTFVDGGGENPYEDGWYFYPEEDWWNIWFWDHYFDTTRLKRGYIEFDVFKFDPALDGFFEIAVNWSTDQWEYDFPDDSMPPLPGVPEALYIGRMSLFADSLYDGHYVLPFEIFDYNPEWVSVDVRGYNFEIPAGVILHSCERDSISLDLSFVITGGGDTCDYYKPQYNDYAPQGMPDFDQKQGGWNDALGWTHCGPVAVANCLWWFDSKFETSPLDPRPFYPDPTHVLNDNYFLVPTYEPNGLWDDHDTNNVQPLVNDLAINYMNTNGTFRGTLFSDLIAGTQNYIANAGLASKYRDTMVAWPTFDYIKGQVLDCQDVILLLTFVEHDVVNDIYCELGAHYVTVAGVCTTQPRLCLADPYYDMLEGEPPAGSAHGGTVHNDANNISGPHGQIHHDPYQTAVLYPPSPPWPGPVTHLPGYPITGADILNNFAGLNTSTDVCAWQGGPIYTLINIAYVICPDTAIDTCDYYKPPYEDYSPYGMPDFDQKQNQWTNPGGAWSHCGPVALANCLWWFDSKFEPNPVDPKPFWPGPGNPAPNDNYNLVYSFDAAGRWDDHDTTNVIPFVDSLAKYCLTNQPVGNSGTNVFDLAQGAQDWLDSVGLGDKYIINVYAVDDVEADFEFLRQEVLRSQDVILLLGFWQEVSPGMCERTGGHYVTVAGTCTDLLDSSFCVSDPMFDANEGEPPAGSAHGASDHNDAQYVSGPHGSMHHDKYDVDVNPCPPFMPPYFSTYLPGYPGGNAGLIFSGQNNIPGIDPITHNPGLNTYTVVEYAVVICPDQDGDGIDDYYDNCPTVYNPSQTNSDGDSHGDACDNCPNDDNEDQSDVDSDGVGDVCDNCPNTANADQTNSDGDTHGDACDNCPNDDNEDQSDVDSDGIGDVCDNCPNVYNLDQANSDTDSHGDACDNCPNDDNETQTNSDGDSHGDVCDNCPTVDNETQTNSDTDSHGDACDNCPTVDNETQTNSDADSHGDACDNCPTVDNETQTNSDADSHGDACDNCPTDDNEAQTNSDADSHGDVCDNCPTVDNESQANSDADSHGDACDNCPTDDNEAQTNSDADSHGDVCDNCPTDDNEDQSDVDSDDVGDVCDNCPNDYNPAQEDSDSDGIGDSCEVCDCDVGNANGDATINILDISYLIAYLYSGGPAPTPYAICSGDANCDCTVNILDITYLIAFLYQGGAPPCTCDQWLINCGAPLRK